jgi:hypothetical protein
MEMAPEGTVIFCCLRGRCWSSRIAKGYIFWADIGVDFAYSSYEPDIRKSATKSLRHHRIENWVEGRVEVVEHT